MVAFLILLLFKAILHVYTFIVQTFFPKEEDLLIWG